MAAPVSQPPVAARASTRFLPRGLGALQESAPASLRFSVGRRHRAARLEVKASGNVFGNYFQVSTYGESHGGGVGCVISGCPPRIPLTEADMQVELDRRRPGQSRITTPRKETDTCKILSGTHEGMLPTLIEEKLFANNNALIFFQWHDNSGVFSAGMTTGTPIHVFVPNTDQRGGDYSEMAKAYRPSHADATYDFKYGVRAVQGGGRSSARETIGRVAAGALAKKILKLKSGVEILAFVSKVHQVVLPEDAVDYETVTMEQIESNIVRCPDPEYAEKMIAAIDKVRVRGDSIGGVVTCIARNVPRGLGSPVFDKLEAELAKAMLSLPASKGFEIGSGFAGTDFTGSEHNDEFYMDEAGNVRTRTNRSGGVQGGISNGEIIYFKVAFKPTATIGFRFTTCGKLYSHLSEILISLFQKKQNTVSREHQDVELLARGRHDPCVVPRAVPMVESMAALVLMDQLMAHIAQCEMFPLNLALQEPIGSASSASELASNLL
ncbi:hypothetical protein U9M48_006836 [Paspalum notatum var. saurae]|uniref:Chorismate synthase n=1 Tax=Paspalum notatum var. saurae TaxID=547442 RepID=A0AAQ3SMD1_PASNO